MYITTASVDLYNHIKGDWKPVHQMLSEEQLQLLKSQELVEQTKVSQGEFKALQVSFWMSLSEIQKHWIQVQINALHLIQIYYQNIYDRLILVGRDMGYC